MTQLFGSPDFDGKTYERAKDHKRLTSQLEAVRNLMSDGHWYTLSDLAYVSGFPESSISARLRDLRKVKFGGYTIERGRNEGGLFFYRMVK